MAAVALAVAATASARVARPQQPLSDIAVKAAFLTKFPEFVGWPPTVAGRSGSLALCLSPSHPFGSTIHELAKGLTIGRHRLVIRDLRQTDAVTNCQVLFVAPSDREFLLRADRLPILTVGDQSGFCQMGGVVNLRVVDGRVRFEISVTQARRAGLTIDSQLIRLAVAVHGGER
jgi:hypothetical protein